LLRGPKLSYSLKVSKKTKLTHFGSKICIGPGLKWISLSLPKGLKNKDLGYFCFSVLEKSRKTVRVRLLTARLRSEDKTGVPTVQELF
jgi:hypothetical protein